ncbi:hypothetical protein LZ575_01945 [Antarcticibacterium sp. 1MA-6-2]|uniref:hypothetical protein n=1 Tax=Antarcticibacterium sp. 1MA-6-2 TaxID=2908210 RepID=UPI001F37AE4C|nr:hypothetical protein [Antarcticibacterium sp. 1MA-6-2]UJH91524.1 hypothetical protein LZ575_01945 [Antarcticibacterium sp. 1MA-6-2]
MKNKLLLISMAGMMVAGFVYSQIYFHQQRRRDLKEIVQEIALTWQEKLHLSVIQTLQLEGIIISYTLRKNEIITANIPRQSKIKRLQIVQAREHQIIKKIMNEDQFAAYAGINRNIPDVTLDPITER